MAITNIANINIARLSGRKPKTDHASASRSPCMIIDEVTHAMPLLARMRCMDSGAARSLVSVPCARSLASVVTNAITHPANPQTTPCGNVTAYVEGGSALFCASISDRIRTGRNSVIPPLFALCAPFAPCFPSSALRATASSSAPEKSFVIADRSSELRVLSFSN